MKAINAIISTIKKSDLESKLLDYKDLCDQIKQLEQNKDRLRKALIKSYFESNSVYISKDGKLIATYMPQDRTLFNSKLFKDGYPKLYDEFSYLKLFFY